jgi:hypothetical protein
VDELKIMGDLLSGVFLMEFALKVIEDANKIGESVRNAGETSKNAQKVIAEMKEKRHTSRKNNSGERDEARGVAGMRGRNTAHTNNNLTYADRVTPIASRIASCCSDIDRAALQQVGDIGGTGQFLDSMQNGNAFS